MFSARYCLDTYCDEYDWRRQAMEVCFRVTISPKITLQSVCLSCSRRCVSSFRMVPYIRSRNKSDPRSLVCDCNATGNCQCRWSPIREVFDKFAVSESDQCINKMQLKKVLKLLRSPFPVEASDIDDAILVLGSTKAPPQPQRKKLSLFARSAGEEGQESAEIFKAADLRDDVTESASLSLMDDDVRIDAVSFERWYRQYYDEPEKSDDMQLVRESQVGNAEQGNDRQILDEDSLGSYL